MSLKQKKPKSQDSWHDDCLLHLLLLVLYWLYLVKFVEHPMCPLKTAISCFAPFFPSLIYRLYWIIIVIHVLQWKNLLSDGQCTIIISHWILQVASHNQWPIADAMASLKVQPAGGALRNLTDVFQFLRCNAVQNRRSHFGNNADSSSTFLLADKQFLSFCLDDRVALLDDAELGTAVSFKSGSNYTPTWVNVLDEINFELTKWVMQLSDV